MIDRPRADSEFDTPTEDALRDHARYFLERTAIRIWSPFLLQYQYERVSEIEVARPGFAIALRTLALEQLTVADPKRVWQAVAALAVVGEPTDLVALEPLATGDSRIAKDARSAMFEIRHRRSAT